MARKKQWHPAFVAMLRPMLEDYFAVETDVAVGDTPRQADIVLLRRRRAGRLPFTGLWKNLTPWNVLEFKGPTVSPREEDADLLVELGLGIHRRLNEEQARQGRRTLGLPDVSFWYLANRLGRRVLRTWERTRFHGLQPHGPGVWRCEVLGRPVYLVSGTELPVEEDSLPLHLIGKESAEAERVLAEFLVRRQDLWRQYGGWLAALHHAAFEGVENMAKATKGGFNPSLEPLIKTMGLDWVLQQVGPDRLIEQFGLRRFVKEVDAGRLIEELGKSDFISRLTPEQRRRLRELLG